MCGQNSYFLKSDKNNEYRISWPIRCTMIFSLEILEKNNDECIFSNLLEENRIVTYQN